MTTDEIVTGTTDTQEDKAGKLARVRAAAPQQARRAGQAARSHPVPVSAGALTVVGAVLALLAFRRRAAQTRAAQAKVPFLRRVPNLVRR